MHISASEFTAPSRERLGAMVRDAGFENATFTWGDSLLKTFIDFYFSERSLAHWSIKSLLKRKSLPPPGKGIRGKTPSRTHFLIVSSGRQRKPRLAPSSRGYLVTG